MSTQLRVGEERVLKEIFDALVLDEEDSDICEDDVGLPSYDLLP